MEYAWLTWHSGHYFDEDTLAIIPPPHHDDSIYASKPNRPSKHPPPPFDASATTDALATEATLTKPTDTADLMATATLQKLDPTLSTPEIGAEVSSATRRASARLDGASALLAQVAPPSAEDEANFSAATKELLDLESPKRPAKTVHLPPEDVQLEGLRQRREAEEEARRKSDAEKAPRSAHLQAQQHDLASSPSSTVGAYSAATPMLPQESPDTSPDSERPMEEVLPPKELRPSSEERRQQEEHDRILEAQKDIARKEAFGGPTPDDQLNWEAREAAAREEEEQRARDDAGGPEGDAKRDVNSTKAEEVMEDVQADIPPQLPITPAPSHDEKPTSQPSTAASQPPLPVLEDDGDSITVVARTRLPQIDTGLQAPARSSNTTRPRMTHRSSSSAIDRQSFSQAVSESPAQLSATPHVGRQASSPEPTPLRRMRHSRGSSDLLPPVALQTPRRQPRPSDHRTPVSNFCSLHELAPLKGLAGDAERDYLEPLFRIQAHDSPNSNTKALPDLVKSAQKYMSTEDHFTTLHERMDYRILRRIYQLQNANKWSLRQMEKANEPEQPTSHMDHMMAEMRWMRKDFKAERKMKKSVCAWLAARCADWIAADAEVRKTMQVKVKSQPAKASEPFNEQPPELDASGDSAPEDDHTPPTPRHDSVGPTNLIVAPELSDIVAELQRAGKLGQALRSLPIVGLEHTKEEPRAEPLNDVSKFVEGKILPKAPGPVRKRSRYEYEDDAEVIDDVIGTKRARVDRDLPPEDQDVALFHPDNKHIRDRLHANNAFRPPSEFVMPATSFYEFRNGSQWVWDDDQKLRRLAKEYSFNWSLIADEMTLPSRYKSSADRRTPWECFERWVELEQLPAEMRKTMYFKTWFQRLEQSQQAAERRYQAQVQLIQANAQNGQQAHVPQRRRTIPSRVEKRKNTRYLWLVDAMRKNAKKRENNNYKQAEGE